MTPQEQTIVLEARDILGRYLSQNPVIGSWQALMDYCALTVRGPIEMGWLPPSPAATPVCQDDLGQQPSCGEDEECWKR